MSSAPAYSYDPGRGRGGFNPRNLKPLPEAPKRRHSLPAPEKPKTGFEPGENAQSGGRGRRGIASAKFTSR